MCWTGVWCVYMKYASSISWEQRTSGTIHFAEYEFYLSTQPCIAQPARDYNPQSQSKVTRCTQAKTSKSTNNNNNDNSYHRISHTHNRIRSSARSQEIKAKKNKFESDFFPLLLLSFGCCCRYVWACVGFFFLKLPFLYFVQKKKKSIRYRHWSEWKRTHSEWNAKTRKKVKYQCQANIHTASYARSFFFFIVSPSAPSAIAVSSPDSEDVSAVSQ